MALIQYLTHINIEFGARKLLAAECERVGIKKPLIVTDAGVRAAGVLDMLLDALPADMRNAVYDGTPPNPNEAAVRAGTAVFNATRLRRADRRGRRLVDRLRQGRGHRRAPRRAA